MTFRAKRHVYTQNPLSTRALLFFNTLVTDKGIVSEKKSCTNLVYLRVKLFDQKKKKEKKETAWRTPSKR